MSNIKAQKMIVVGSSQVIPEVVGEGMIFVVDLSLGWNTSIEIDFPEEYTIGAYEYDYIYDFVLDWGDGRREIITQHGIKSYDYGVSTGIFEITITGICEAIICGVYS